MSQELNEVIENCGKLVEIVEVDYTKNIMSFMRWTRQWARELEEPNKEFLFLIRE